MLCGVVSVAFTRLVDWFSKSFESIKEKFEFPAVVCHALGALGAGIITNTILGFYKCRWNFTYQETASAPGIWLLAQLAASKVVATALCKVSGLVGGLYAPSLMIGASVGAVFGGLAGDFINSAIPGNAAIAQPQAYALVILFHSYRVMWTCTSTYLIVLLLGFQKLLNRVLWLPYQTAGWDGCYISVSLFSTLDFCSTSLWADKGL